MTIENYNSNLLQEKLQILCVRSRKTLDVKLDFKIYWLLVVGALVCIRDGSYTYGCSCRVLLSLPTT